MLLYNLKFSFNSLHYKCIKSDILFSSYDYNSWYASLNRQVLTWLLKSERVCSHLTLSGSMNHSIGAALVKPCMPMAFLIPTDKTDSLFL